MAVKKRLGEMLVDAGIIDETQLNAALGHQRRWGGRIGQVLVDMKLAGEEAIVNALALKFGFDVARLDQLEPYAFEQAKALVPRDYAVRNHVFPLAADTGLLVVAMSDPTNLSLADELSFKSGKRVKICIAGENAIAAAVRAYYDEEVVAAREAIVLEADDGTAIEPLYDPVGATSNEELQRFFQQSPATPPPQAAAAPAAPVKPPPPRGRPPSPAGLQLEDQRTESYTLTPAAEEAEELQPIPLESIVMEPEPPAGAEGAPREGAAPPEGAWGEEPARQRELTAEENVVLDALGRLGAGDDSVPTIVRPPQLTAALIRLLLRKGLVTEQELLDEILRS